MNKSISLKRLIVILGIPFMIIAIMILVAKSPVFQLNPHSLAFGITFDLLLVVPLVYFLLIRKTTIPKTTVFPFLILGIITCSIIIPIENQQYLKIFKFWVLPIIEISILSFVVYTIKKTIKIYKQNKVEQFDFFTILKETCYKILPKYIVIPVVTEIAVFYYGFLSWKRREFKENEYSYHKNSGTIALLVAIIFIIAIETVAFHILLLKWSAIAAWILTGISLYSGIQIFGFLKSMYQIPISITNNKLYLRYGIMNEAIINIENIESIYISSKDVALNKKTRKLSFLGELESHNIIVHLKTENTLIGLYGFKNKFRVLAFYIDNNIDFVHRVNCLLKD